MTSVIRACRRARDYGAACSRDCIIYISSIIGLDDQGLALPINVLLRGDASPHICSRATAKPAFKHHMAMLVYILASPQAFSVHGPHSPQAILGQALDKSFPTGSRRAAFESPKPMPPASLQSDRKEVRSCMRNATRYFALERLRSQPSWRSVAR
jgi:hypothetical protein